MQKRKKIGFFQKIFLSIIDFRVYPYILKTEKIGKSLGHFFAFLTIIIALISFKYSANIHDRIGEFLENYDEVIPEFTIQSGELNVQYTGNVVADEDTVVAVDTEYTYEGYIGSEKFKEITKYDSRVIVTSDMLVYQDYSGSELKLDLSNVQYNYDKQSFYNQVVEIFEGSLYKIIVFVTIFISVFLVYGVFKLIEVFLYAVFASLVSIFYGIRVDFRNYMKIAIYIVTLPYILETVAILYTGALTDYAVLVSNALAYVYIFCAIKAVKADAFMILMNRSKRKNPVSENEPKSISDELSQDENDKLQPKNEIEDQTNENHDETKSENNNESDKTDDK